MYLLAKDIVSEYENLNLIPKNQKNDFSAGEQNSINNIEVYDPKQISILDQIEEKEKSSDKKEKYYSNEVYQCYEDCKVFFSTHLLPGNPKEYQSWFDVIDKLNRLDGIPFERIVEIVQWARKDKFWSKNFLSLRKLRTKDKNGVKYVVIFNEKLGSMQKNTAQSTYNAVQEALNNL